MSAVQEEKSQALSFVTKKVLVTFNGHVALMLGDSAVFAQSAICEYQQAGNDNRLHIPDEFTIVGLPDGKKLTKSLRLRIGYMGITAMVELD